MGSRIATLLKAPLRLVQKLWESSSGYSWDKADADLRNSHAQSERRAASAEKYPGD